MSWESPAVGLTNYIHCAFLSKKIFFLVKAQKEDYKDNVCGTPLSVLETSLLVGITSQKY